MVPALEVRQLCKTYPGGVAALKPIDLTLHAGERVALLGPSGSGKSTLLRLIIGLETPDAGEVRVQGTPITALAPHLRPVAFLPQRPALYPHLNVVENLQVVKAAAGLQRDSAIERLRLKALLKRRPHELSGGEKQRVALAKLLLQNRPVWLLDEPFSSLDPLFRAEFRTDLLLLMEHSQATMLFVTHDPIDAWALGHRIGVLAEGVLQQLGTAEELRTRPRHRFVSFCMGTMIEPVSGFPTAIAECEDGGTP